MFAVCEHLIALGWFQAIHLTFLPPGHTHSNLDQKYAVISQKLRQSDLLTLDHVIEEVSELFAGMGPLTRQVQVPVTADYEAFYAGRMYELHGHGTCQWQGELFRLHAFKITTGTDDEIGVFYKEHDEFGRWRGRWESEPDWQPVIVLKSAPENEDLQMCPKLKVRNAICLQS